MARFVFREMLFGGRGHNPFSEWNPEENTQALRRSDNPDTSNRGVLIVVAACNLGDQMKGSARCTDRFQCGMRRLRGDSNFLTPTHCLAIMSNA
jgi:hypothetical protein